MIIHLLISSNAFQNSLFEEDASEAIRKGLNLSGFTCTSEYFPIGDAEAGTGNLLIKKFEGVSVSEIIDDPMGRKIKSSCCLIESGQTAVIEMSEASRIKLLKPREQNARLVIGIDYFLKLTSFEEVLERSDVVITGEGSIDEQTLQGGHLA